MVTGCVLFEIRNIFLNIVVRSFSLKGLNTVHTVILYFSSNRFNIILLYIILLYYYYILLLYMTSGTFPSWFPIKMCEFLFSTHTQVENT
jgi:hypothetical protein